MVLCLGSLKAKAKVLGGLHPYLGAVRKTTLPLIKVLCIILCGCGTEVPVFLLPES